MIRKLFQEANISISDEQIEQLKKYYDLIIDWNKKINLTAITDFEDVVIKHFIDSALLAKCSLFSDNKESTVLDLGTGAGFPGIVLAIFFPNKKFTLVDALNKRIKFLEIVVDELCLINVELIHGRAEDLGANLKFRNQFDFVVSRAVASMPILLEYCIPFVKKNGYFISYKGIKIDEEIECATNAMNVLNCTITTKEKFILPNNEERYIIFFNNNNITDKKYPRKAGKPKKNPL